MINLFLMTATETLRQSDSIFNETTISILALIVSVVILIKDLLTDKRVSRIAAESNFFKDIFHQYLIKTIPEGRQRIRHVGKKVDGTAALISTLNDMRQASLFFKYNNKNFYNDLKDKLQNLEDKLVEVNEIDEDSYAKFKDEINNDLEKIYSTIFQMQAVSSQHGLIVKMKSFIKNRWKEMTIIILLVLVILEFIFFTL